MARLYPVGDGSIRLEKNGHRIWSSDGPPLNLLPEANWLTIPLTVAYPDFVKRNAHCYQKYTDPQLGRDDALCMSVSTILPQEWGPFEGGAYNLPDIVLGTVPDGVNALDRRLTMTRSKAPTPVLGKAVPHALADGEMFLPGGSCRVEAIDQWERTFAIKLIGNQVVLRRTQSTAAWAGQISWATGSGNVQGWTHGGGSNSQLANPAYVIQSKPANNQLDKWRGAPNQCSLADPSNFSSIYTGTLIVRPGFIKP